MPQTEISADDLTNGEIGILDLLVNVSIVPSKAEGRRVVTQGGLSVDGEKITDPNYTVKTADFEKGYIVVKKGKKVFHKIILK